ncbi:MAG: hypothetical protein M1827_002323 [Pycnora praestabilis]|nr:MAG: hypothetical protein M1827_002323 [Pycnora praestabilis]
MSTPNPRTTRATTPNPRTARATTPNPRTTRATFAANQSSTEPVGGLVASTPGSKTVKKTLHGPEAATLPEVGAKSSFSYGASGQPDMPEAIVGQGETGQVAASLDKVVQTTVVQNLKKTSKKGRSSRQGTVSDDGNGAQAPGPSRDIPTIQEEPEDQTPDLPEASASQVRGPPQAYEIDQTFNRERTTLGDATFTVAHADMPDGPAGKPSAVPSRIRRLGQFLWKSKSEWYKILALLMLLLLAILLSFLSLSAWMNKGWPAPITHRTRILATWDKFDSESQDLSDLEGRVFVLESDVTGIKSDVVELKSDVVELKNLQKLDSVSIEKLEAILPDAIMVRRNEDTGDFEVLPEFWTALKEKIQQDFGTPNPSGGFWNAFRTKNDRLKMSEEFQPLFEKAFHQQESMDKQEFIKLLQDNYEIMSGDIQRFGKVFEDKFNHFNASLEGRTNVVADRVTRGILRRNLAPVQLDAMAWANLKKNLDIGLRHVNFFSIGLGAVVDPSLSSPTYHRRLSWTHWFAVNLLQLGPRRALGPLGALNGWEDVGDCWCTPSQDGKAQLTVLSPRTIFPTEITIEHMPNAATLDIAAAPQEMELWAQIDDQDVRQQVDQAQAFILGPDAALNPDVPWALGKKYVRIAKWIYDIHGHNHIQTFQVDVNMKMLGAKTNKLAVRALTNWGTGGYTCLYRVRVFGTEHDKQEPYPNLYQGGTWSPLDESD